MSLNSNLQNGLFVFVGGGTGCVLRYFLGLLGSNLSTNIPVSTLVANILGCFIIGIFFSLCTSMINVSQEIKLLVMIGFCGGLTTFSTFSLELITLMAQSKILALGYAFCSVICCLIAVVVGICVGGSFFKYGT